MLEKSVTDWQSLAGQLEIEGRAFINGRYVDALSGQSRPTINPGNGHEIVDIALCGNEDAEVAITGARTAFESGTWSKRAPMDRKMVLIGCYR
jgi:4-guanidinobutyraldehyde dehydrogenase/NAD-dependent aldehyde dehydrogenase